MFQVVSVKYQINKSVPNIVTGHAKQKKTPMFAKCVLITHINPLSVCVSWDNFGILPKRSAQDVIVPVLPVQEWGRSVMDLL